MKKSRDEFLQAMQGQRFGVEIEFTGISKQEVTDLLANYFNDNELFDSRGRDWEVKYDSSIIAYYKRNNSYIATESKNYKVELITPVLEYEDIPMLQEIVRLIRQAGGITGAKYRAGIHIHISDEGHNQNTLRNLIRLVSSKQYLLERALQIPSSRLCHYCQYVSDDLAKRSKRKFRNMNVLQRAWDNTSDRYSMLNLSSLFSGKGIELRMFNSSLHAGVVKTYIQFSLALCQSAKDLTRCSSVIPRNDENDKYAMRTWLCRLNLVGDEFKTCRKFMCEKLTGESAFSNPDARKKPSEDFSEDELPIY